MTIWIVPCNLKFYDVIGAFKKFNKIIWKQIVKTINKDDYVYIYIGKPISALKYKCKVNKVGLSNREIDDQEFIINGKAYLTCGCYMELELVEECSGECFSLDSLVQHGLLGNIQGPRRALGDLEQYLNSLNEKRLEDEIIEITGVIEDGGDEEKIQDIMSVYIENVKYIGREYFPYEEDEYDVYEGEMFYYRIDGTKKYFSSEYYNKNNTTYYKVNPVKIICISDTMLRIVNSDDEGLYCYDKDGRHTRLKITDREPEHGSKNYKDILYYRYELESEQTVDSLKQEINNDINGEKNTHLGFGNERQVENEEDNWDLDKKD